MRRLGLVLCCCLGCTVPAPPAEPPVVRALYDPGQGVIPRPNDLLRDATLHRLVIPLGEAELATRSGAEVALIQELNTRDGWPSRTTAELSFSAPLRADSVTAGNVRVFQQTPAGVVPLELTPRPDPPASPTRILLDPPGRGWQTGARYFIAALGGPRGLAGAAGEPVVADAAFYFLRQEEALTDHPDALPGSSPGERRAAAERLETIRQGLAPDLALLEASGLRREEVVALWSFTVTQAPEIWMDKQQGKMPLPSDFLRNPATGLVDLPLSDGDSELARGIKLDLRSFDGFSTSADLVFETTVGLDPLTLSDETVQLYAVDLAARTAERVPLALSLADNDTVVVARLAGRPLAQRHDHLLVVGTGLRSRSGLAVEPMVPGVMAMSPAPVFAGGASTVPAIDGESAARLELVRARGRPALDLLFEEGLLSPELVAAAWPFRTLSIDQPLREAAEAAERLGYDPDPQDIQEKTPLAAIADFPLSALSMLRVAKVVEGTLLAPDGLDPETRQRRADGGFAPRRLGFTLTIPAGAPADRPVPVVIFGHGLMAERRFVLSVADALAAEGLAAIAVDLPFHGERTVCVWTGPQCIVNPLDQGGDLICPDPCERGSSCAPDGRCVDGDGQGNHLSKWPLIGMPQATGGAFLEVDRLVGSRDHFLQGLADLSTLERSLRLGRWAERAGLRPGAVGYLGQSLGGILGALFVATHPRLERAVLNVPGGDLVELFRASTVFGPHMEAFFARHALQVGSAEHRQVLNVARWIMDGVDPQNVADLLLQRGIDGAPLGPRQVLVQMATLDLVIPNDYTRLLADLAQAPREDYLAEHGFLVVPVEPAYGRGVGDAARLLGRGQLP